MKYFEKKLGHINFHVSIEVHSTQTYQTLEFQISNNGTKFKKRNNCLLHYQYDTQVKSEQNDVMQYIPSNISRMALRSDIEFVAHSMSNGS